MPDTITESINPNEGSSILRSIFQEAKQWNVSQTRNSSQNLVSPAAAVGALGELSPGGALMRGFQEQSLARKLQYITVITGFQNCGIKNIVNLPYETSSTTCMKGIPLCLFPNF